ncbi:hypothetical protein CORT_0B08510 [Candida orthopsilosis Co 90-125]|uniref:Uncharacterized protein n=1 Tax=Candida orthopsilosis (strain 90-125) TaxID=1136231 RepID=H8X043_CANO9|nr:hypothetical protein CORT_0B08510 [Candida orthopsilosis Co 90-125]CCG22555.1 hypothetical protein CORT_0B08510 [Candida orthopsilosis Co 90-125]
MPSQSSHLPIRRVYDTRNNRIIETIKFNDKSSDFNRNCLNKVKVDVKIAALSYPIDFHQQLHNVVPSKRIIVKKRLHRNSSNDKAKHTKYLVYPYTTCQLENIHHGSPCCCDLTYGEDLDGGLQESLYVPESLLIPIPKNVSLHDVCFIWCIILPFYIYSSYITNNTCIILNDIKREINEVLIILNHLNIDQAGITILDESKISSKYSNRFDTVFCFNSKLGQFAEFCCQHPPTGLGIGYKRQRISKIFTNFPIVAKASDKIYQYMKLGVEDKKSCIELLQIIRDLNTSQTGKQHNDSITQPRNNSTATTVSSSSASTTDAISLRQEHSDNQSITTTSNSSQEQYSKGHCSWFWCDEDVDSTNYSDLNLDMDQSFDDDEDTCYEDEDVYESSAVHDMNKRLNDGKPRRVCYFNRSMKPNVNASII